MKWCFSHECEARSEYLHPITVLCDVADAVVLRTEEHILYQQCPNCEGTGVADILEYDGLGATVQCDCACGFVQVSPKIIGKPTKEDS